MFDTNTVIFDFDGTLINTYPLFDHFYLLKEYPINTKEYRENKKEYLTHLDECYIKSGGKYVWQGIREIDIIRHLLIEPGFVCDEAILFDVVNAVTNTLIKSKQDL